MAGATITFKNVWKVAAFYLFFAFFPSPLKILSKTQVTVRVIVLSDILQQLSESSRADWSRAVVYESIDRRNDITCHAVPVVLCLVFRQKLIKCYCIKQTDYNFPRSKLLQTIEMTP